MRLLEYGPQMEMRVGFLPALACVVWPVKPGQRRVPLRVSLSRSSGWDSIPSIRRRGSDTIVVGGISTSGNDESEGGKGREVESRQARRGILLMISVASSRILILVRRHD